MKYFIFFMISFFIVLNLSGDPFKMSNAEYQVNLILSVACNKIEKKYKLRACATGSAMPGNVVKRFTLAFNTNKLLSKEEIRLKLINAANELLEQIKKNDKIQAYLESTPATMNNVQIIIYNEDELGYEPMDPEISTAEISNSILTYHTVDSQNIYNYKNEFSETYEEALRKIR